MLLSITTTHRPATDLGYLLHKHPDKVQVFDISGGKAHVFYPEASEERCTCAMVIEIDSVDLVRRLRTPGSESTLQQYVNDRPYVASSFTAIALAGVFGSALNGRSKDRPELLAVTLPLEVKISVLKARHEGFLRQLFEPLGYEIEALQHPLDPVFPDWGMSPYFSVTLRHSLPLQEMLSHLYILLPVLDHEKHYYIQDDEARKLLEKGGAWLAAHPMKEIIAHRYLKGRGSLTRMALAALREENGEEEPVAEEELTETEKALAQRRHSLHQQRLLAVRDQLAACGAKTVLDLGCGEGKLLQLLLKEKQFERIFGLDVAFSALQIAGKRLRLDQMAPRQRERIELAQGSLTYRDQRLAGYDAAALVEVIEHLDPDRLDALERVVFQHARPRFVVLTTPNREYNVRYETLQAGLFRHDDHRFEWTRAEFTDWSNRTAARFGYRVDLFPIGEVDDEVGGPSQMAVFQLT